MIIFHAQPNRNYPYLANMLAHNFNVPYQFWEPFEVLNKKDEKKALESKQIVYKISQKVPRRIEYNPNHFSNDINSNGLNGSFVTDFCYGTFKKERLLKARGDFVFTIIRHPIKRIHDMYYYAMKELEYTDSFRLRNMLKSIGRISLEEFIDLYIKNKGSLEFKYNGIKFKMIDEVIQVPDIKYDFVGIDEHLDISLSALNTHLNIDMINIPEWNQPYPYTDYRFKDLEKLIENEDYKQVLDYL